MATFLVNGGPKASAVAHEMLMLCELTTMPHERWGFRVKPGPALELTPIQALALDVATIRGASRHRREAVRKAGANSTGLDKFLNQVAASVRRAWTKE